MCANPPSRAKNRANSRRRRESAQLMVRSRAVTKTVWLHRRRTFQPRSRRPAPDEPPTRRRCPVRHEHGWTGALWAINCSATCLAKARSPTPRPAQIAASSFRSASPSAASSFRSRSRSLFGVRLGSDGTETRRPPSTSHRRQDRQPLRPGFRQQESLRRPRHHQAGGGHDPVVRPQDGGELSKDVRSGVALDAAQTRYLSVS